MVNIFISIFTFLTIHVLGEVTFISTNPFVIQAKENFPANTTLAILKAQSNNVDDDIKFELSTQDFLGVNPLTGRIFTKFVFDSENLDDPFQTLIAHAYTDSSAKTELNVVLVINNENDNAPKFEKSSYIAHVPETFNLQEVILQVKATDADQLEALRYNLHSHVLRNANDVFVINQYTGEIKINQTLDYENKNTYEFVVTVTDGFYQSNVSVIIFVDDVDDQGPIFEHTLYNVTLKEGNYPNKTFIIKVNATDEDSQTEVIKYSLSSKDYLPSGNFSINEIGEIFIVGSIDHEKMSFILLLITATSAEFSSSTFVHVAVTNVNDNLPKFLLEEYFGVVAENAEFGTEVLSVNYEDLDGDELVFSIISEGPIPFIVYDDGKIAVDGLLDRELTFQYHFQIQAKENSTNEQNKAYVNITIILADINDNNPQFFNFSTLFQVKENQPFPQDIFQFKAFDPDLDENGDITYSMSSNINSFAINNTNGVLSTNQSFDRETKSSYLFNVFATDNGSPQRSSEILITIHIVDVDDNFPICQPETQLVEVVETRDVGTLIASIKAVDADENSTIAYQIVSGSDGYFTIGKSTGQIKTIKTLNREKVAFYNIKINATDNFNKSAICHLNISVLDVNDNNPIFDNTTYQFNIIEELSFGVFIGSVHASDDDPGKAGNIEYYIPNQNIPFSINQTSGAIQSNGTIDRETMDIYRFLVYANDLGNHPRTSLTQVIVKVIDTNDNSPLLINKDWTVEIKLDTPLGQIIFKCEVRDLDIELNGASLFSTITPLSEWFSLNTSSGELKLVKQVNTLLSEESIVLSVTNIAAPYWNDTKVLRIIYMDSPSFPRKEYLVSVKENTPPGIQLIVLNATSMKKHNKKNNFTYSIIYGDQNTFRIHPYKGIIDLIRSLDREVEDRYQLTVSVQVNEVVGVAFTTVIIRVLDDNDNAPIFKEKWKDFTVYENTDITVISPRCVDEDCFPNNLVKYNVSGSEIVSINSDTGEIKFSRQLDYELDNHQLKLTVICYNVEYPYLHDNTTIQITLSDANDNAPLFEEEEYEFVLEENVLFQKLGKVKANDFDELENSMITYKMRSKGSPNHMCFSINKNGMFTSHCSFDYESGQTTFKLRIEASDNGHPPLVSMVTVVVNIKNVNDNKPVITKRTHRFWVLENQTIGTLVGTIQVVDVDNVTRPCQYCVFWSQGVITDDTFTINPSGTIFTSKILDFDDQEGNKTFQRIVRAYQFPYQKEQPLSENPFTETTVYIDVKDVNDNQPHFLHSILYKGLSSNHLVGDAVEVAEVYDKDISATFAFSISSGNEAGFFSIAPRTGFVTTARSLHDRSGWVFKLRIVVSDDENDKTTDMSTGQKHFASQMLTVFVFNESSTMVDFVVSNATNVSYLQNHPLLYEILLSNTTKRNVFIHEISSSETPDSQINVKMYAFDADLNKVVSKEHLKRLIANKTIGEVFWKLLPLSPTQTSRCFTDNCGVGGEDTKSERSLLMGVILGVCLLVLVLTVLSIRLWLRGERRYGYTMNRASQASHNIQMQ